MAALPDHLCAAQLARGQLAPVLPGWSPPAAKVLAVVPSRRGMLPAVRRFLDYLQLDEATLQQVAQMGGGEYHRAGTAEALRSVYLNLAARLQVNTRETELTSPVALLAAVVLAAGASLSTW